jgi:hypothetical protein
MTQRDRKITRKLALLALAAGCVPPGAPGATASFIDVRTSHVGDPGAPTLRVVARLGLNAAFDAEGYLDGVSLVVNDKGSQIAFDAPQLTTSGFPLDSAAIGTLTLEVPSPFTDRGTFDAFCTANARSVDITARIYIPQNDDDPEEPPPLTTATINAPVVETGTPPSDGVFSTTGVVSRSYPAADAPAPAEIIPWQSDKVVFSLPRYTSKSNTYDDFGNPQSNVVLEAIDLYEAQPGSVRTFFQLPLAEAPRLAASGDSLYYAGPSRLGEGLVVGQASSSGTSLWSFAITPVIFGDTEPVVRASALSAHAGGLRVAVRSAVPLPALVEPSLDPPAGKYFGSFVYDFDLDGNVVEARVSSEDVVAMIDLADGRRAVATSDLPPRDAEAVLRVRMEDEGGSALFTYEEPTLTYEAALYPLPDGGLLLATEDREVSDTVLLVRLSNDGSVIYRLRALGHDAHAAPRPDGGAFWSFTGALTGLPAPAAGQTPDRAVPLLVEVTADGQISRVSQLGCSGWSAVGASSSSTILLGSFGEWMAMGSAVQATDRRNIFASGVD